MSGKLKTKVSYVLTNALELFLPVDLIRICITYHFHFALLFSYKAPKHIQGELLYIHEIAEKEICLHFISNYKPIAYSWHLNSPTLNLHRRMCWVDREAYVWTQKYKLKPRACFCEWDFGNLEYAIYYKPANDNTMIRLVGDVGNVGIVHSQENGDVYYTLRDRLCMDSFSIFYYDSKSKQRKRIRNHTSEFRLFEYKELVFFKSYYLITHQSYFAWYDKITGQIIYLEKHEIASKNGRISVLFLNQRLFVCSKRRIMIYEVDESL